LICENACGAVAKFNPGCIFDATGDAHRSQTPLSAEDVRL